MLASAVPSARRKEPSTVSGSAGLGPAPWRSTYSWPSGKAGRARWATCTARVVLPTPPMPARAETAITLPSASDAEDSTSVSSETKDERPVKSGTEAGSWAGRTGVAVGSVTGAEGSARAGSAWRMRCWSSLRPGRGSTPSSSDSRRRVSAYTARASAWRPLRYSASISSSRRRSRSGCAAVRAVSSETASAWQPCSRSRSRRVSSRPSRHSSRRARWASAYGPGTPARGSPSHRSRAWFRTDRARLRSPAPRAFSASVARSCATARSRAPSRRPRTAYPPDSLTRTPGLNTFRSREAYVRTAASAWDGGSDPQSASISSAAVAVRPSRSSRAASRARCWGEPVLSASSPCQARTGPSTPKRSGPGSATGAEPDRRCSGTRGPPSMRSSPSASRTTPSVCLVPGGCVSRGRRRSQTATPGCTEPSQPLRTSAVGHR